MKILTNNLPKLSRQFSISPDHYKVIQDILETLGCVNQKSPNAGMPNVAMFMEALAEKRLRVFDVEEQCFIDPDADLLSYLRSKITRDRVKNPFTIDQRISALSQRKNLIS
jgi:hypothetical protein